MPIMIFTMLVVLVLAAGVIAVVVMGMEGTGRTKHPEIAEAMQRTARHLNGEGEPPRALVAVFDEMDEVGDINVRELPRKLRTAASAASAASARSARTAWSSLSARSAVSANPPETESADEEPAADPAAAISAALAAPAPEDPAEVDPYGVWGPADLEAVGGDTVDRNATVDGDTVVRVRLPEGDDRA